MKGEPGNEQGPREAGEDERGPWGLAAVALVAGLLQVLASVALGMARADDFEAASSESSAIYLLAAALVTAGVFAIYLVRERPAIALTLGTVWPLGMFFGLRKHATVLGLAFHGEFILHHLAAILAFALAVMVPLRWARDEQLGPAWQRMGPAALAVPGAALLLVGHLSTLLQPPPPGSEAGLAQALSLGGQPWITELGAGLLIAAWPLAVGLFWTRLGPAERRPIALILLAPMVVRLATAGVHGLSGALVAPAAVPWLGATMVVASVLTLGLLRPRLDRWVTAVVGIICLFGSMLFYYFYEHGFGELEDGLGGLLQSLFGFQVPYPPYTDDLRSAALMLGLFFMFVTVYTALVSTEDRSRGLSLGLMLIAGLGLSSPHLALMVGAGALLFIETLLPGAPHRELGAWNGWGGSPKVPEWVKLEEIDDEEDREAEGAGFAPNEADLRGTLEGLSERLAAAAPIAAEDDAGSTILVRDHLGDTPFELRARVPRRSPADVRVELTVGLPGRSEAAFELVPDTSERGPRPAHLLARSHRVIGDPRQLEAFGDEALDALTPFPTAYLRAWEAGAQVELGAELSRLRVDSLEALVRCLARALRD
ncbi:hypothetical protein PPSIR1_14945 [Plesiocystis pacifica SIR-1]|uniref:Uncharacterized protein n=1 Tax=Plesiocystis pacifica SIR-1 TaxID=391625 RepID=A6G6B6_9BACT|nr:hypothetical protein [Plesiocystis pacifica]EDM78545.1 hypothetical protein PPSIR1_14945 [Plesiocystis pacifica SIR-1]